MLKPVEKQRVAEEIAEQLRALILNGQYPPGSKLPPERELSKRLRVNRASLREALKKLEHLGLVRIRQGDGTRVQNFMETGGKLVQVTQTARDIVNAEDLSHRVLYTGPADEVGALATTFNEMLNRLQSLFEGQRRFLAEAAHELRTPLASMLGNVDLLVTFGDDSARRHETISALQRTGGHVSRLLDDLLLLAQAEAGWHLASFEVVALDDLLIDIYESAMLTAGNVNLKLERLEPASVRGDPNRLRQVFMNLIDNAVKYSLPGGDVTISLFNKNCNVHVTVSDHGSGIPEELIPLIFEPFFRAPTGKRIPGAGLGLAIVRWIVREHGGDVNIRSESNKGTTVALTLPAISE